MIKGPGFEEAQTAAVLHSLVELGAKASREVLDADQGQTDIPFEVDCV
jgi:hypothetical protein